MTSVISYSNPDDEFGSIIYRDPQLKKLIDSDDREIDFSDENSIIIEPDIPFHDDRGRSFWSDR
jgi:hypothetical protein